MFRFFLQLIGIILVSFILVLAPARASDKPLIVGYFPAFKGLQRIAQTPIQRFTHINIAFANPDAAGRLRDGQRMACMPGGTAGDVTLSELTEAAQQLRAHGAKVLLSVAGGVIPACSGDWAALLAPAKRAQIVSELAAIVDVVKLDGIDVDIEGALLTTIDQAGNYTPFIAALSKEMRARGKLLTVATASYEGGMIPVSSIPYFDLVMPMSYDTIGPSWGTPGAEHATEEQAAADIALWLARGVARERLILGVPFYGYGFGAYAPGGSFADLLAKYGDQVMRSDVVGRACAGCDYVTLNSLETLRRKAALAKRSAGGIMIWEITHDTDYQLLTQAIFDMLYPRSN